MNYPDIPITLQCEKEIENFKKLPEHAQNYVKNNIFEVICESFLMPADEDYFTARNLALKKRHRAFFWAACQAVEKYLKYYLLIHCLPVKDYIGHPISEIYSDACEIDSSLADITCDIHEDIKIHKDSLWGFERMDTKSFIELLMNSGGAGSRYNDIGVKYKTKYLLFLDSLIFSLREKIKAPNIELSIRGMDAEEIKCFYHYNPWFSKDKKQLPMIPNPSMVCQMCDTRTTVLEDLIINKEDPYDATALQWLKGKIKVPKRQI